MHLVHQKIHLLNNPVQILEVPYHVRKITELFCTHISHFHQTPLELHPRDVLDFGLLVQVDLYIDAKYMDPSKKIEKTRSDQIKLDRKKLDAKMQINFIQTKLKK